MYQIDLAILERSARANEMLPPCRESRIDELKVVDVKNNMRTFQKLQSRATEKGKSAELRIKRNV